MEHTKACVEASIKAEKERADFFKKYPNYCKSCEGWGGFVYYENHGLPGAGERIFDMCGDCIGNDICPRCGYQHPVKWQYDETYFDGGYEVPFFDEVDSNCLNCGWNCETDSWGLPEVPPCYCDYMIHDNIPY